MRLYPRWHFALKPIMAVNWIAIFWGASLSVAIADSVSGTINFSATFVGGSCEVDVPALVEFNGGNALLSAIIEKTPPTENFELKLDNCSGWGGTPSIKVRGDSTNNFGDELFRDNSLGNKDSNGYGVLLKTTGNTVFAANTNIAKNKLISAKSWVATTQLNTIANVLPMTATLSCSDCNYLGRQGGKFNATVTFDFIYE